MKIRNCNINRKVKHSGGIATVKHFNVAGIRKCDIRKEPARWLEVVK